MNKWSLFKLLSLAQAYENSAYESRIKIPDRLKHSIEQLTNTKPSSEQWTSWIETNSTLLMSELTENSFNWRVRDNYIYVYLYTGEDSLCLVMSLDSAPPLQELNTSEIVEHSILRASTPLPNLYLFTLERPKENKIIPPHLAHEAWLIEAIKYMGYGYYEQSMIDFININKSKIDYIRRSFQYPPKELGGGADGLAFDIGKDRVLKVFKNRSAYNAAIAAINRLHTQPELSKTEAMIDDAGELKGYFIGALNVSLFFYIIEKMIPVDNPTFNSVSDKIVDISYYVQDSLYHEIVRLQSLFGKPEFLSAVKELVNSASNNIKNKYSRSVNQIKKSIPQLREHWLENYIEEIIMKIITGRTDLHMGNLGVTSYGELRYYDPAYL